MNKQDQISIIWCVDDVIWQAKERGIKIGKKQAREVLQLLERKHDANIGINWDVIDYYIDEVRQ